MLHPPLWWCKYFYSLKTCPYMQKLLKLSNWCATRTCKCIVSFYLCTCICWSLSNKNIVYVWSTVQGFVSPVVSCYYGDFPAFSWKYSQIHSRPPLTLWALWQSRILSGYAWNLIYSTTVDTLWVLHVTIACSAHAILALRKLRK